MNLLVLLFALVVIAVGVGLTYLAEVPMGLEERLGVGIVVGTIVVTLSTLVLASALGFDRGSVLAGAFLASAIAVPGWLRGGGHIGAELRDTWHRLVLRTRHPQSLRPLAVVTVTSWVVTWRILANAYHDDGEGGVVAGHLSTYGDWNAHLAYAGSFVHGDNLPPSLPFAVGNRLTYHVLTNVFAADFATLGVSVQTGLIVTSGLLAVAFPLVFWFAGIRITHSRAITAAAFVIFTLSGGLGFVYALADLGRDGIGALWELPRTYARLPERDIWFDNAVLAYLYAQRPNLVGLPVVLIVIGLVWNSRTTARPWWFAGTLAGASAGFSIFGFGGALLFGGWLALREPGKRVPFFGPALALGLPVLFAIRPATSHLRWQVGWMASTLDVFWPWFWLLNLGLFLPVAVLALARGSVLAGGFDRVIALPLWSIFVVTNLVAFHPWEWNNTHYLIIWVLLASFPVAALVVGWMRRQGVGLRAVGAVSCLLLVLTGGLDVWRAAEGSAGRALLTDAAGVQAADWAREVTAPRSVFLVAPHATQPFVSFGARRVVSGHSGWVWDLGVPDWADRVEHIGQALRGEASTAAILDHYEVDFVVIGPLELGEPYRADLEHWRRTAPLVFDNGTYRVFYVRG